MNFHFWQGSWGWNTWAAAWNHHGSGYAQGRLYESYIEGSDANYQCAINEYKPAEPRINDKRVHNRVFYGPAGWGYEPTSFAHHDNQTNCWGGDTATFNIGRDHQGSLMLWGIRGTTLWHFGNTRPLYQECGGPMNWDNYSGWQQSDGYPFRADTYP